MDWTNEGASAEVEHEHVIALALEAVDCGRVDRAHVRRELLRWVDLAQVAKVVLADEPPHGVAHQLDVELELLEVGLRDPALPLGALARVRVG